MNKEIRILNGLHSGARLQLAPGIWNIGSDDMADVQISDWRDATLTLTLNADGSAILKPAASEAPGVLLVDMQPLDFDGIALCIGAIDAVWPSEEMLLQKLARAVATDAADSSQSSAMLATAQSPVRKDKDKEKDPPKRWLMFATVLLTMGASGAALLLGKPSRAGVLPETAIVLRHVQDGLFGLHQSELEVLPQGDLIVVRGMVSSSADVYSLRKMLDVVAPKKSMIDVMAVNDVIANIQQSLHDANLTVSYVGQGKFVVSGAAHNVQAVQKTVTQMAADFGTEVKDIRVDVSAAPRAWMLADSDSALVVDSLQYMQALDGTKRFPSVQEN